MKKRHKRQNFKVKNVFLKFVVKNFIIQPKMFRVCDGSTDLLTNTINDTNSFAVCKLRFVYHVLVVSITNYMHKSGVCRPWFLYNTVYQKRHRIRLFFARPNIQTLGWKTTPNPALPVFSPSSPLLSKF